MSASVRWVAAFLALVCFAPPARASVAAALSLEELVAASETIVVGRARSASSRWDGPRRIVTDVELEVEHVAKGRPGRTTRVTYLGGSVGEIGMRVEGAPRFRIGGLAVVFAERHPSGSSLPVGMSQGVMPVEERGAERIVFPGGHGLALVRPDPSGRLARARGALAEPRPLSELLEAVHALARRGAP